MKLTITGSGGFRLLPRPGCECISCRDAHENNYMRMGASLFIHDEEILFDTPEDIAIELVRSGIGSVKHIFYTHWHPDHVLGMRVLEQLCTKWADTGEFKVVSKCKVDIHMPPPVMEEIIEKYGQFFDFYERVGIAEVKVMGAPEMIGDIGVEHVTFLSRHGVKTHSTAYVITKDGKKLVYAPCDITPFPEDPIFEGADLMILQIGWLGEKMELRAAKGPHYEISMAEIIEIIEKYGPKQVILTHIGDENELTLDDLARLEKEYIRNNLKFAYDGMYIDL